jgi:hypothetical protein
MDTNPTKKKRATLVEIEEPTANCASRFVRNTGKKTSGINKKTKY